MAQDVDTCTEQHKGLLRRSKDKVSRSDQRRLFLSFFLVRARCREERFGTLSARVGSGEGDPSRKWEEFLEETFREVKVLTGLHLFCRL